MEEYKQYIDKLREEYIDTHVIEQERDLLIAENNIEKRDIKGYHGREILELLQNADDAYQKSIENGEKPSCELEVSIRFIDNVLTITNTGTFFDKNGIKAIVQGNNSPKEGKYIGNKGTGFRSVLNWANKVRIFSGEFAVEFSKEIANGVLKTIIDKPQIIKQIEKNPNLYIPMLAVPQNIEYKGNKDVTTIEIEIDSEKTNDDFSVMKQLESIDLRILLFLPNISQIHIVTDDQDITYKRQIKQNRMKTIALQKTVASTLEIEESFYVFDKTIPKAIKEDNELKDILLSIAVPEDYNLFNSKNLYSFFPLLDTESPFNCVLHASYILDDHRNTVNSSADNKTIIKRQIEFLVEIANQFVGIDRFDIAYKMLVPRNFSIPKWFFLSPFSKFELEQCFFELLSKQRIFQTVNGKTISVLDKPKTINCGFPDVFIGDGFDNLLKPLPDEKIYGLLNELARKNNTELEYNDVELCSIINSKSSNWNASERVGVFVWWNSYWKKSNSYIANSLPNLLKTQDDRYLKKDDECYFLVGDFDSMKLPTWVNVPALQKEYQTILFNKTEDSIEVKKAREKDKDSQIHRIICQKDIYPSIKFTYRDRNNIISAVNKSVDTKEKAVEFVNWLWENYGSENTNWSPPDQISFVFPSEHGEGVADSKHLYFGNNYNNPLAEKLFPDEYSAFPALSVFSIDVEEQNNFVLFVEKFGVKRFPAIEVQKVEKTLPSFRKKYEENIKSWGGDIGSSRSFNCTFELPYINKLETILTQLSTKEILEWILKDDLLLSNLGNRTSKESKITYKGSAQQRTRTYEYDVDNYILVLFNESPWIEIKEDKFSPQQVLQSINTRSNVDFAELTPVLSMEKIEQLSKELKVEVDRVRDVFGKFKFCNRITDLNSNDFYGIMLKLPELEFAHSVKLSRKIYSIVEQSSFFRAFDDSENKRKFFLEGKVLVKYQGQLEYYPSKQSYLPSSKIIIKKETPIVEKGQRTNNDNFKKLFGCQEYTKSYSLVDESVSLSKADAKFQLYFSDFKKYIKPFAENNENIGKYGRGLNVKLVDKLLISEDNIEKTIDDEYVCIRDSIVSWYITVFSSDFDTNVVSEILENIYSNIANSSGFDAGKIGELFRARNTLDREFLIKKEFGSLTVLEDDSFCNEIKNNFVEVVRTVTQDVRNEVEEIDFDDFSSIKNGATIIKLFKSINIDIEQFNEAGFVYRIDLIPYYKKQLREFVLKEKRRYKDYLFTKAKVDVGLQDDFIKTIGNFERFEIENYRNSVDFDVKQIVIEKFGSWNSDLPIVSAEEEYSKNYEIMNPDKLFEDEIADSIEVRTMVYFGRMEAFKKWLEEKQNIQQPVLLDEPMDIYGKYRGMLPNKAEITYHPETGINGQGKNSFDSRGGGVVTNAKIEQRQHHQKIIGNKGELVVYNLLCEQVGENKVFPRSEAFVELGILKPGQAISGEYDISYLDENGKEFFVEVKTGDSKSFFISPGELQFAKDNAENYKLYLVFNMDKDHPDYIELPMKFWEDEKFRKKEIIERIEFEF